MYRSLQSSIHSGARTVVEIGCGVGTDGIEFARNGANYVGVDLTPNSVELTRERFEVFGVPAGLKLQMLKRNCRFLMQAWIMFIALV